MALDAVVNFAKVTASTGYDAAATAIVLTTGHGARLAAVPFNATWWNSTDYPDPSDDPNRETIRVTALSSDTLSTIVRAQEGTSASVKNLAGKTYSLIAGVTAKTINDDIGPLFTAKAAHYVYAGPVSGANATPAFRALVALDIPDISSIYLTPAAAAAAYQPLGSYITGPASPANSLQFNNAGAFGGSSQLTWNGTRLRVGNASHPNQLAVDCYSETDEAVIAPIAVSLFVDGFGGASTTYSSIFGASISTVVESFDAASAIVAASYDGLSVRTIATAEVGSTVTLDEMIGIYNIAQLVGAVTVTGNVYGEYIKEVLAASPVSIQGSAFGIWVGEYNTANAPNKYAFWYDGKVANGAAVYRIKADGVMAYYNPGFGTDYTPGATVFERVVQQWNANVLEYGPEAGSTGGTLRAMRLLGASVSVVGNVTAANLSGTNTGDQDLSAYATSAAVAAYAVPLTRTVNGHALSANVSVTASDLSLGSVENTALSTWAGSANLVTLGAITSGSWGATAIPVTKGGTGSAFFTVAGPTATRIYTFPDAAATLAYHAETLAVFAATTSAQLAGVLSDETGFTSGALAVFSKSPVIETPTIASFVNAGHSHLNAAGGGTITSAAVSDLASTVAGYGYLTSVTAHALLSATHSDTTAGSVARGDMLTGQGASAKWARLAKGTANQVLAMDGSATDVVWATITDVIGITIDGSGSVITTGTKGFISIPRACTITSVRLLSTDASATAGSIVIDIWKDSYANYPPTVADTITASAKPTLSSASKSDDTTLTGWSKAIAAGDVLGFKVDSASIVTRVTLELTVTVP